MRVLRDYHSGQCSRCDGRRDVLTVWHVRPARDWEAPERLVAFSRTSCVSRVTCDARLEKRRSRGRQRSAVLVLVDPKAPDAPSGICRWCGDPIVREDGSPDRRRSYHYGPESYRYGGKPRAHEPDCKVEWERSRTWDARRALERLAELAGESLCCADCGRVVGGPGAPWDADHEVPLEDGGNHSLENLRVRCSVPCHRDKTAREATERAARRAAA